MEIRGIRLPGEDGLGGTTGLDPAVVATARTTVASFVRGDANADGGLDISDAVTILLFQFAGRTVTCSDAVDADDDSVTDLADAIWVLSRLYRLGDPPPSPYPGCGPDPPEDTLGCSSFGPCSSG